MKHRLALLSFGVILFVLFVNTPIFCKDFQSVAPQFTFDEYAPIHDHKMLTDRLFGNKNSETDRTEMLLAKSESETLDDDLMDEYDDDTADEVDVPDPLFYLNQFVFTVNDIVYSAAIKPLAIGYNGVMPDPARKGVRNFFHNLLFPVRLVNNLLQGKISKAGTEVEIFCINTTIGVLGFGQVAQNQFDLHTSDEDLGQTLGYWSIGEGFYLVLPILGPSTFRDTIGLVGDSFLKPVNYVEPWELSTAISAYEGFNNFSFRVDDFTALQEASIDPYTAFKNAYIQNQNKKIKE